MTDQEKISKLEQRVDRLEDIIKNLSHITPDLYVGVMKDQCNMHITLRQYIKEYCDDFKHDGDHPVQEIDNKAKAERPQGEWEDYNNTFYKCPNCGYLLEKCCPECQTKVILPKGGAE